MDGHWRTGFLLATFLLLLGVLEGANPVGAFERSRDADAQTRGQGVDIQFTRTADGGGRAYGHGCAWQVRPATEMSPWPESESSNWYDTRPGPEYSLYVIFCNGDYSGTNWLGPPNFGAPDLQPVIDGLLRRVTVLPATVEVRPDQRGVTGIPSLFWVDGYGEAPLQATESAFGLTVTVVARLVGVEWDFGDGTPSVHSGLGEAWPERSSVRHAYRDPSEPTYRLTANLVLQPSYTVDGVAGDALEPITVPVTRDYVVHEVQAIRLR